MSAPKGKRIFIYVQHLLGIGHLRRSFFIAQKMAADGSDVHLISGGMPVDALGDDGTDGVTLHQLPPTRVLDSSFKCLVDQRGIKINEAWRNRRVSVLLELFNDLAPAVLITETYPFGRRMMRFELIPLLQAALAQAPRPLVVASIRDILQPKSRQDRNEEICAVIDSYYDHVLVHGDRQLADLSESFPLASRMREKLFYTGYVVGGGDVGDSDSNAPTTVKRNRDVVVSAGGSAVGLNLLNTAIEAAQLPASNTLQWRILVGGSVSADQFSALQQAATQNTVVERHRADFQTLLANSAASVSQAGYNTVMDTLVSGTPAVLVPFSRDGELEQNLRARALAARGLAITLDESALQPQALLAAVEQARRLPRRELQYDLRGAANTAQFIQRCLHG